MPDMTGDMGRMTPDQMREAAFLVLLQEQVRSLDESHREDLATRREQERTRLEREDRRDKEQKKRDDDLFGQMRSLDATVRQVSVELSKEVAQTYVRADVYNARTERVDERLKDLEEVNDHRRKQISNLWYGLLSAALVAILIPILVATQGTPANP